MKANMSFEMKLFGQKCFFPSLLIPTDHWKCCFQFFVCLKYQHKWNAWLLVFYFTGYFSAFQSLFVYALLILIWHIKPAGFWKLADSDWVCLMDVKAQIKKGWMCIHWNEMWNKTTTIHPHRQLMVYSCVMYCTSVKYKPLHTKLKPYMGKEKPRALLVLGKLALLSSMHCCFSILVSFANLRLLWRDQVGCSKVYAANDSSSKWILCQGQVMFVAKLTYYIYATASPVVF